MLTGQSDSAPALRSPNGGNGDGREQLLTRNAEGLSAAPSPSSDWPPRFDASTCHRHVLQRSPKRYHERGVLGAGSSLTATATAKAGGMGERPLGFRAPLPWPCGPRSHLVGRGASPVRASGGAQHESPVKHSSQWSSALLSGSLPMERMHGQVQRSVATEVARPGHEGCRQTLTHWCSRRPALPSVFPPFLGCRRPRRRLLALFAGSLGNHAQALRVPPPAAGVERRSPKDKRLGRIARAKCDFKVPAWHWALWCMAAMWTSCPCQAVPQAPPSHTSCHASSIVQRLSSSPAFVPLHFSAPRRRCFVALRIQVGG